jgi:hypothetical protein
MSTPCETVVAALATGGPIRRWRALRHAARCPQCAAARDELRQVAEALVGVPLLTPAQRRLWVAAAEAEITVSTRTWLFRPVLVGALAAVVLGAAGIWWASHPRDLRPRPSDIAAVDPSAIKGETLRDVEVLRGDVVALARELDDLRRRADLLDARKEVDALMARLAAQRWSNGL